MFSNLLDLQRKRQMQGVLGDDPMQGDSAPQEGGMYGGGIQPANITPIQSGGGYNPNAQGQGGAWTAGLRQRLAEMGLYDHPSASGGLQPANITPANVTPLGMGQQSSGPDPNQMVWGHSMGEMFPELFQGAGRLQPARQPMAPRLTGASMGSPTNAQQRY